MLSEHVHDLELQLLAAGGGSHTDPPAQSDGQLPLLQVLGGGQSGQRLKNRIVINQLR